MKPRSGSVCLFLLLAAFAILALQSSHGFFPGDNAIARAGRLICQVIGIVVLIIGSRRLLQRDGIANDRLGLDFSLRSGRAFLIGMALATAHLLLLLAALLSRLPATRRGASWLKSASS